MIRRLVVLLVLLAMPFALLVDGCAAIVGLDESYPLADGDEAGSAPPDASVTDGGLSDAAGDATMMQGDAASVDSGSPGQWRFDELFEGGVIPLGYSTSPPVIDVDDGGTVRVVYTDGKEILHLCEGPDLSIGCPNLSSVADASIVFKGFPIELLSNASMTVLVINTGTPTIPGPIQVLSVAADPQTYALPGDCLAVRGVTLDDQETVTVAASCDGGYDLLRFSLASSAISVVGTDDAGPTGRFDTAVRGEGSDVWLLGCQDCTGGGGPSSEASYLHSAADGSAPLASGVVGDSTHDFTSTDLLAQEDGGLLVGSYSLDGGDRGGLGFFTAPVPGVGDGSDGGTSQPPNTFDLAGLLLQPVTDGRIAVAKVDAGVNVIIGALTSVSELAIVTVDDRGLTEAPWPSTPQLLPFVYPVEDVVVQGVAA